MVRQLFGALVLCSFAVACGASVDAPLSELSDEDRSAVDTSEDALKGQTCGGFAGLLCPSGYACIDNPTDNCSPKTGGADCSGICVRTKFCPNPGGKKTYIINDATQCKSVRLKCDASDTYFSDACGCGCKAL